MKQDKRILKLLKRIDKLKAEIKILKGKSKVNTKKENLQDQLKEAIDNEDYEKACQIRDLLKNE